MCVNVYDNVYVYYKEKVLFESKMFVKWMVS